MTARDPKAKKAEVTLCDRCAKEFPMEETTGCGACGITLCLDCEIMHESECKPDGKEHR